MPGKTLKTSAVKRLCAIAAVLAALIGGLAFSTTTAYASPIPGCDNPIMVGQAAEVSTHNTHMGTLYMGYIGGPAQNGCRKVYAEFHWDSNWKSHQGCCGQTGTIAVISDTGAGNSWAAYPDSRRTFTSDSTGWWTSQFISIDNYGGSPKAFYPSFEAQADVWCDLQATGFAHQFSTGYNYGFLWKSC